MPWVIAALLALVATYQCGVSAEDRELKAAAEDSLEASRADRDHLRGELATAKLIKDLAESQNEGLLDRVDSLTNASKAHAGRAAALSEVVEEHARAITDTTKVVPVRWFYDARDAAIAARRQAADAERARALLRDSVVRNDSIAKAVLVSAIDSVKAHLARQDARDPVILDGVQAGSDRCAWGPFDLFPCITRKVAFVGGVILGGIAMEYGDDVMRAVKQRWQ
jgi:hypothetical protein